MKSSNRNLTIVIVLGAALAAGAAVAAGAGDEQQVDIYYSSQAEADTDLARFDTEHPQCQLWTNWQRMCSRTGENGKTICTKDKDMPVRPSRPFCSDYGMFSNLLGTDRTDPIYRSKERFCADLRIDEFVDGKGEKSSSGGVCYKFTRSRPFNGRDLAQLKSPKCGRWERGQADVLRCVKWIETSCWPRDAQSKSRAPGRDDIIIPDRRPPDTNPVIGVSCTT